MSTRPIMSVSPTSISKIQLATQDFNEQLLIGQGGFGKVYRGTMKNGTKVVHVAIKRSDPGSAQGETEFWAEVEMLSVLRHCNLVSLIGYRNDNQEMILVYEYMPNGTLQDHLHKHHTPLSFSQRLKMCIGAARGLQYLHTGTGIEQGIIHHDVKSSNILLDNNWVAKISDFGLSKISPIDKPSTGVNTLVKGTFGYFDPNYFSTGKLTRKSDVFSFGVILLEVLCRKRAVDSSLDEEQWSLVEWAQDFMRRGKLKEIIDPYLKGEISRKCLNAYAKIVDGCLNKSPKQRITMTEVVCNLESILALHEKQSSDSNLEMSLITFGRKFLKHLQIFTEKTSATDSASGEYDKLNLFKHQQEQYATLPQGLSTEGESRHRVRRRTQTYTNKNFVGEETIGWPSWLNAFTRKELKGWLPLRADTFEKLDKIGQGHYSNVYKARDTQTGNLVALKRNFYKSSDLEGVKRTAMEVAVLRRLDHPNVIKLKGIVTARVSQSLYLVFEYMDHDLTALSTMQFTESQVKHYMRQLFCGLKYCHDNHVLHRDLKPSDLLVNNHGVLKIAGFGSASFFDLIHEQPMTNRIATDWYMAPELRLGVTEYGVGVDLWSAGCILAGLFAKEADQLQKIGTLFGSHSDEYGKRYKLPLETLYKPQLQSIRYLTEPFKDFPPSSLSLLDVLLSVDPAKRPSAASALESKFFSEVSQEDESQTTKMEYTNFITTNTTSTRLAKQKDDIKRSVVWNHFTEFLDNDGKKKSRCNYCASTFGTSMLTVHMKSCASNHSNQFQTRSSLTVATTKVEDSGKTKVGLHAWRFDQQVAKKSIIEMLIRDKLPLKFVENEGFRRCMEQCQPSLVIPSTSTLKRDLYELFLDEKAKLKSQLIQSILKVCLTIDTWTSLQRANYLCLTAHFIDNNWRLQKKVINFCRILSLKGSDVGRIVYLCLVDWGLENIFTITIDNASSDDTAIQYMRRKCKWNLCVLKSKWTHVRCITCVVNLVVQDIIGKMDGSVDKVRAAVRYVTRSPTTLKKFKEFAKLENAECQKTLCLDVPNRWSSTYLMLSVAIIYQQSFDKLAIYEDFMYNNDLGDQHWVPSSFDWDNVKRLVGFLQHCYKFTLEVSGTKYTTSNNFLDYVCCIHSVLKECFSSEDHVLREMSSRMKRKLDEYWGDIDKFNLLVFIASMFDPRKKFMYLEVSLCNIYGDEDGRKISALCKSALYELFNDYIGIHSDIELELDRYLTEDIEEDNEDFTVLDWWKRRSTTFPILSLVARDVLAIPISTVSCESCLPTKGSVLESIGASLTPETIQSLICYQDWIRSSDVPVNVEEHIRELDNFADA